MPRNDVKIPRDSYGAGDKIPEASADGIARYFNFNILMRGLSLREHNTTVPAVIEALGAEAAPRRMTHDGNMMHVENPAIPAREAVRRLRDSFALTGFEVVLSADDAPRSANAHPTRQIYFIKS